MIYSNCNYELNDYSWLSGLYDPIFTGYEAVRDLFFEKTQPVAVRSLEDSLNKVRVNPELQKVKSEWKSDPLSVDRKEKCREIYEDYKKQIKNHGSLVNIEYNQLFGDLGLYAGVSGLWMPGIAMMATHLKEKKGLEGLFACASRKALCSKLAQMAANPEDQRCALILGTSNGENKDFPLHKIAICVEKKAGVLQITVLDSLSSDSFSSSVIYDMVKELENQACSYKIFVSEVPRESAGYGCGVFALQDAVSFLQDKQFLEHVDFGWEKTYGEHEATIIVGLPPAFVIGMQSMTNVQAYGQKMGAKVFEEAISGRNKTLNEYLGRNVIVVDGRKQNHYITKKTIQYQQFIVSALKELSTKEVKNLIHPSLLV